jgi:UDP-N-acetylmuramoyl-L-alanyl-D-glutamate--2,6-diaminopimelate ligase
MRSILQFIKKILGKRFTRLIRPIGHGLKALGAALWYRYPGKQLILVGITGTKGKTTTTVLTGKLMNKAGFKTGYISTAMIFDGKNEYLNPHKMGTIDSVVMNRVLRQMVKNGCTHAILEMTSQGLEQHRHWGLGKFAGAMLTNLYPEHLEAHGGWRPYLRAKSLLLREVEHRGFLIVNHDEAQKEATTEIMGMLPLTYLPEIDVRYVFPERDGLDTSSGMQKLQQKIRWQGKSYQTKLISNPEILDLYFAIKVVQQFDPYMKDLKVWLSEISSIPGRMEFVVNQGVVRSSITFTEESSRSYSKYRETKKSAKDISIMVDYAHEPASMEKLLQSMAGWKKQGLFDVIIHVISNDGAGRDDWKKPVMGDLSYKYADFTVVTTDNYDEDDDPKEIIRLQMQNFPKKEKGKKYITEVNREKAFKKALEIADGFIKGKKKVTIVSTGVGTEDGLTQPGGVMKWDERGEWLKAWYAFVSKG